MDVDLARVVTPVGLRGRTGRFAVTAVAVSLLLGCWLGSGPLWAIAPDPTTVPPKRTAPPRRTAPTKRTSPPTKRTTATTKRTAPLPRKSVAPRTTLPQKLPTTSGEGTATTIVTAPTSRAVATSAPLNTSPAVSSPPATSVPSTLPSATVPRTLVTSGGKPAAGPRDAEAAFVLRDNGSFAWLGSDPSRVLALWELVDKNSQREVVIGYADKEFKASGGNGYAYAIVYGGATASVGIGGDVERTALSLGLSRITMPEGTAFVGRNTDGRTNGTYPWRSILGHQNIAASVFAASRSDALLVSAAIAQAVGSNIDTNQ